MAQSFDNPNLKKRIALIVFVKGSIAPIVLYLDEPYKVYENIDKIIRNPQAPKTFEIEANGPIKKVTFVTNEVTGCAIQEEIQFSK